MPIGGKDAFLSKVTFRRESNWVSKTKQMLKDMESIEERADDYANKVWTNPMFAQEWEECKRDYVKGATEQKAIDEDHLREVTQKVIDKAIQYWDARLRELKQEIREGYDITRPKELIDFKKAMEK